MKATTISTFSEPNFTNQIYSSSSCLPSSFPHINTSCHPNSILITHSPLLPVSSHSGQQMSKNPNYYQGKGMQNLPSLTRESNCFTMTPHTQFIFIHRTTMSMILTVLNHWSQAHGIKGQVPL